MDAVRFVLVGALGVAVLAGWASIPLLVAFGFLLGSGQTLFDNAAQSLIPALVSRDQRRLERANSQLYGAQTVSEHFLGPPAGGFLFGLANSVPFLVDAVSFLASSALIASIGGRFASERPPGQRPRLRAEIGEGLRWLAGHRLLRALCLLVALMNLSFMAGEAIMVLFAQEILGLDGLGYGLLLTGYGAGGVLGSLVAARLGRVAGTGTLLVSASLVGAAAWLGFGLNSVARVGGALIALAALLSLPVVNDRAVSAARDAGGIAVP